MRERCCPNIPFAFRRSAGLTFSQQPLTSSCLACSHRRARPIILYANQVRLAQATPCQALVLGPASRAATVDRRPSTALKTILSLSGIYFRQEKAVETKAAAKQVPA